MRCANSASTPCYRLNYTRDTTSGAEGIDLLRDIKKLDADLPVIVMTAWGTINVAVEAMRHGAGDFIEKPWDNQRLMSVVATSLRLGRARRRGSAEGRERDPARRRRRRLHRRSRRRCASLLRRIERVAPRMRTC